MNFFLSTPLTHYHFEKTLGVTHNLARFTVCNQIHLDIEENSEILSQFAVVGEKADGGFRGSSHKLVLTLLGSIRALASWTYVNRGLPLKIEKDFEVIV